MRKAQTAVSASKTRRERVELKEEAIVDVAYEMFLERGYAKTTIAEIARRSGVADGTVYLYFQNKEAVARAVVASFYIRLTRQAQEGVDELTSIADRLRFLARHHLENVMNERRILEMLPFFEFAVESYDGSELFQMNKAYVTVFDRVAKDGISAGDIRKDLSLWALRDVFFGAMEYGARTMLIKNRPGDLDHFIDNLMRLVVIKNAAAAGSDAAAQLASITQRLEAAASRIEKAAGKIR